MKNAHVRVLKMELSNTFDKGSFSVFLKIVKEMPLALE